MAGPSVPTFSPWDSFGNLTAVRSRRPPSQGFDSVTKQSVIA